MRKAVKTTVEIDIKEIADKFNIKPNWNCFHLDMDKQMIVIEYPEETVD